MMRFWWKKRNKETILIQPHHWLCPHCLREGNRIKLECAFPKRLDKMRHDHMWEFHRDIMHDRVFGN